MPEGIVDLRLEAMERSGDRLVHISVLGLVKWTRALLILSFL